MSSQSVFKQLTAIIIDDELHGRENLKKIIENYCHEIKVIGIADSVDNANKIVRTQNPDIVFLDINMPVLDGFDFLDGYDERNFMVVFVSAHEEFGIKALKAGAADYLLKPVNIKELKQTVKKLFSIRNKKLIAETESEKDKLVLPAAHGFEIIMIDQVIRLEADGCYTKVVIKDGKNCLVTRTLKDFEETLPSDKFIRVHKSHMINLNYVKDFSKISGNYLTMIDGSKVEISRRKTPEFMLKIKSLHRTV